MRSILKKFVGVTGYKMVKSKYLDHLIHINSFNEAEVFLLLYRRYKKDENLTFFDIGANVGQTCKRIKKYFPESGVYCFEPVSDTFTELIQNSLEFKDVYCFNCAIGNDDNHLEIFHRKDSEWNSLVPDLIEFAREEGGVSEQVKVMTLDRFVEVNQINKIHLMKSDTEGFELQVLEGANNCLKHGIIDFIYIEVGFKENDFQHVQWEKIVRSLKPYEYNFIGFFDCAYSEDLNINYANALFVRNSFKI